MKKIKLLEDVGLNETAAKIYLYLIKNKKATILEVARGTGIARTNIYHNVKILIENNLIVEAIEKGKRLLVPEKPNNLVKMIQKKEMIAEEISEILLPDFEKNKYESKIRFAYGSEGFKKLLNESLNAHEKILRQIVNYDTMIKYTNKKYMEKYWIKRKQKKINVKILATCKDRDIVEKQFSEITNINYFREIRFLPNNLNFTLSFVTYDNKIHFFAPPNESYCFEFESESFSTSIKNLFDFLWALSNKLEYIN